MTDDFDSLKEICGESPDAEVCIISRIIAIDNPELCEEVEEYSDECYVVYAVNTGNTAMCDIIVNENFK